MRYFHLFRPMCAATVASIALIGIAPLAQAKGCIKGAAVGGVAGHVAGHHGVLGAAAGCVIGHHEAAKKAPKQDAQRNSSTPTSSTHGK